MKLSDFYYDLPPELIAQEPLSKRTASRLLYLDAQKQKIQDKQFIDIINLFSPNDLLVFNNTQVIPARLYGKKSTGGKVEVLIERLLADNQVLAHVRANKSPKAGSQLILEESISVEVNGRKGNLFQLSFPKNQNLLTLLEKHGHIPLPPYIERQDHSEDKTRYQTVFAKIPGAVAAPTAGLHFDKALLAKIQEKGIQTTQITLHVGAGTFQPVRVNDLTKHKMHAEWIEVSEETCQAIHNCKKRGGKVIAVGTTSVRSLEAAASEGNLHPFSGDTRLFITPGYAFKVIDAMITNFHLPESTLLMLVSAFSGDELIKQAYLHAIKQRYRFFSYGDAMFLTKKK